MNTVKSCHPFNINKIRDDNNDNVHIRWITISTLTVIVLFLMSNTWIPYGILSEVGIFNGFVLR